MDTKLAGQGSEARVTGAYAGGSRQHLDFDTTPGARGARHHLRPRLPRRPRRQRDRRLARHDPGRPGAQQTDAFQENRNLLLSTTPTPTRSPASRSRPTTSAAPTPRPSPRSTPSSSSTSLRGLDEADAKRLMIEGFLEALVERLAEGPVRDEISPRSSGASTRSSRAPHAESPLLTCSCFYWSRSALPEWLEP